ncbi:MAG: hypothetical protein AAGI51_00950 [Pseudomonadota bacterium]
MIFELIAAVVAALSGAGIALLARRMVPASPKWIVPVAAGAAMLGYSIWSEYTWRDRTVAALPEGVVVMEEIESRAMWRPWTYAAPQVLRFSAVDAAAARRNPDVPSMVMANVILMQRFAPTIVAPVLVDCAEGRRADIADGVEFDDDGAPLVEAWRPMAEEEPLRAALCA